MVHRDIEMAELAEAKMHICHISAKESVDLVRQAKKKGLNITAEVTPHHISLTDEDCKDYDTNMKMNPPLRTKEDWVKNCRADTVAKVKIKVDIKKYRKLTATGDLIFTNDGIRGPVVLDFAREITPVLESLGEVPILVNLTKGLDEDKASKFLKSEALIFPSKSILEHLSQRLPLNLSKELCILAHINPEQRYNQIPSINKSNLLKLLAWTPLVIVGHAGFKLAMITRGGITLKEINPKTMESRIISGLYFCGEVMNFDGPCGGYNLQWSFSSGFLAGTHV